MPRHTAFVHTLLLSILLIFTSCYQTVEYVYQDSDMTDEYVTGYPFGNAGPYLDQMKQSVKRITSTSYYSTYVFDPEQRIRPEDLASYDSFDDFVLAEITSHTTSSGTAVVIYNSQQHVGLLTSDHVVSSPDTLYEFSDAESTFLESMTVKTRQINWLIDTPYLGSFEKLASDEAADLAVIGARIDENQLSGSVRSSFPVFPYKFGNPEELPFGAFTYNIGFPKGHLMVTTGLVSSPNRDRFHSFLSDALFNPGFSGGVVVAIRGGIPRFEWVGIARSASANREWLVVPNEDLLQDQILHHPYQHELYVEEKTRIEYGITHIVSSYRIQNFLQEHSDALEDQGYRIRL